jgi:hypothetical protein
MNLREETSEKGKVAEGIKWFFSVNLRINWNKMTESGTSFLWKKGKENLKMKHQLVSFVSRSYDIEWEIMKAEKQ